MADRTPTTKPQHVRPALPPLPIRDELEVMLHSAKRIIELQRDLLRGWVEPIPGVIQCIADDWMKSYIDLDRRLEADTKTDDGDD